MTVLGVSTRDEIICISFRTNAQMVSREDQLLFTRCAFSPPLLITTNNFPPPFSQAFTHKLRFYNF
jgi:hypothetical protein